MGIAVLGPLEVDEGLVHLGARDRMVLAALAARPGEARPAEELADAVWGERLPASWSKNLQGCVSRLRKVLGAEAIETTLTGYRLTALEGLDVVEFERLADRARELLALGEPERARYAAGQALHLWRGRPLPELEEWEPASAEASRLEEVRLELEELQVEAALRAGHHPEVLSVARSMVERAPLREVRWTQLALAQYRAGQQAEALRTLHRLKVVLSRELGLDPGPEVAALEQAILRQEPGLLVPVAAAESSTCPYPGLRPYDEDDAELFFGRDRVVEECLDRLLGTGLLVVVGPSGSGKSSVLRAGVVPALRARGHPVRLITPGRHPVEALTSASSDGGESAVVVVDQAEELFSLCDDLEERTAFLHLVLARAERVPMVLGLRADRTGELAAYPDLARRIEPGLYLLGAMSSEELRTAVEGPAGHAGLVVEPGLVDLLVREVESEPGALPLLSHALRQTWLRREGRTLTVEGYRASGGIRGAVAQSAEALYLGVDDGERALLRELLLRMVVPGHDGDPVRQRLPVSQLLVDPRQERLVDLLVAGRLVTSDDGVVELAHEAVARAWPRLRSWLEEDAGRQRLLHHLTLAAADWEHLGRPDDELYRGARLTAVEAWHDQADLTALEQEFLDASLARRDAEQRAAAERAHAQLALIRRLRLSLAGGAVLLVLALVAGVLAVRQADHARRSADAALARQLSAQALSAQQVTLGALLAVAAVRVDDTPETRASLSALLSRNSSILGTSEPVDEPVRVLLSPDQRRLAVYGQDGVVHLLDPDTGRVLATYDLDGPDVTTLGYGWTAPFAFSPDGKSLAVASQMYHRPTVRLIDSRTGKELAWRPTGLPKQRAMAADLAWSGDARHVMVSLQTIPRGEDRTGIVPAKHKLVLVWDLRHPQRPPRRLDVHHTQFWERAALSPDGSTVYLASPLAAYDVRSGHRLWAHPAVDTYLPVRMSPDGRVLAETYGANDSGKIALFDTATGRVLHRLTQPTETAEDIAFSGDSAHVASGSGSHVWVWNVRTGALEDQFQTSDTIGLALDEHADRAWTVEDTEDHVTSWDLSGTGAFLQRLTVDDEVDNGWGEIAPDGRHAVLYVFGGGEERVFVDLDTGEVSPPVKLPGTSSFTQGGWSPDSRFYADGNDEGTVSVLDTEGRVVRRRKEPVQNMTDLSWSADGSRLLMSDLTGHLRLLDGATLRPVGSTVGLSVPLAYSLLEPDGRTAFVVTRDRPLEPNEDYRFDRWALVDLDTGDVVRRGDLGPDQGAYASLSPDGRLAAVSGYKGELDVVDTATGATTRSLGRGDQLAWTPFVAFSDDGNEVITSGSNGAVTVYDAATTAVLDEVTTGKALFTYAQFRPGTHEIAIMNDDGEGYLWDTSRSYAVDFACRIAGRDLTPEEWRTYLGDRPREALCPGR